MAFHACDPERTTTITVLPEVIIQRMTDTDFEKLLQNLRSCTLCSEHLPLEPKPIFQIAPSARILIVGQAPGTKAHLSGQTFNDPSGDRLRSWLGFDRETFYDSQKIAIFPMGLCYPGRLQKGGDKPPRPECARLWRHQVIPALPNVQLTLLVGSYAQDWQFGRGRVTDRVRHFRDFLPRFFPLPHPSWRTGLWEKQNPWFMETVIPALRQEVTRALTSPEISRQSVQTQSH